MSYIPQKLKWGIVGELTRFMNRLSYMKQKNNSQIIRFNTAENTDNLGDFIIMHYCNEVLDELFNQYTFRDISTHTMPSLEDEKFIKETKFKFVCGTNILTSHIESYWSWQLPDGYRRKRNYKNVVMLGLGWNKYEDECTDYTKMIYKTVFHPTFLHSVRDQYSEDKLKRAGIKNVINTGCPTTWRLTPEFCQKIPTEKATDVVTTITDYRRDAEKDSDMLKILEDNYRNVYLWIQGKRDREYLETLYKPDNLIVVDGGLKAYQKILKMDSIDYVGTRLHAGVYALNHHVRSIIIAVDNRALEMGKDIDLPLIERQEVNHLLRNKILSSFKTEIKIKQDNIDLFKNQFKK